MFRLASAARTLSFARSRLPLLHPSANSLSRHPAPVIRVVRHFAAGSPKEVSVVEERGEGGGGPVRYVHRLTTGRHVLLGDLMPAAGGTDAGPSPKELALLSLGMCTSMTVRMFADASRFPLTAVSVNVRERTPEGGHLPDGVEMEVVLEGGDLTEAQRQRLLRAAAGCPVKRMFAGEMRDGITTRLG